MRRIFIVPLIAGILLTMSACGAKEETTSTSPSTQASAKSSDSDTSSTTKADDTSGEDGSDDDRGSTGGGLPSGFDNDCIAISTLYITLMANSTSLLVPGAVSAEELEELEKSLDEARSKAEIPDEIAEDFEVWSAAWAEFGDLLAGMGTGGILDPANADKLEEAGKIMDDPEVKAAGDNIEAYVNEHCAAGGLVKD